MLFFLKNIAFLCCFIVLSIQALASYIVILFWLVVGIVYVAYRIISSTNVEFEYSVTNGELDVDKIINKKRRKHLLSADTKSFEIFEPVTEELLNRVKGTGANIVLHAEGDISSPDTYVAVFNKNGAKYCLYFQPSQRILDAIARRRR